MSDYTPFDWLDDVPGSQDGTLFTATRMNQIETAIRDHIHVIDEIDGLQAIIDALATSAALQAHADDTTDVHGIDDTAALIVNGDPRLADVRIPTPTSAGDGLYWFGSALHVRAASGLAVVGDQIILASTAAGSGLAYSNGRLTLDHHLHPMDDVNGLAAALAAKSNVGHTHASAAITDAPTGINSLIDLALLRLKTPADVCAVTNIDLAAVPATIDGVTLTTGMRVLLAGQTAAADNGLYEADVSGIPRTLSRTLDADTAADFVPGFEVAVKQGTVGADSKWLFTNNSVPTLGTTALNFKNLSPLYVTSLPTSPVDGMEIFFLADGTNGVEWHFRYRAAMSGSYKWHFLGGPSMVREDSDSRTITSTTYVDLPTDPISFDLPALAGDFEVTAEALIDPVADNDFGAYSYALEGTAANDAWAAVIYGVGETSNATKNHLGLAASTTIAEKARTAFGNSVLFRNRRFAVKPIRVG